MRTYRTRARTLCNPTTPTYAAKSFILRLKNCKVTDELLFENGRRSPFGAVFPWLLGLEWTLVAVCVRGEDVECVCMRCTTPDHYRLTVQIKQKGSCVVTRRGLCVEVTYRVVRLGCILSLVLCLSVFFNIESPLITLSRCLTQTRLSVSIDVVSCRGGVPKESTQLPG